MNLVCYLDLDGVLVDFARGALQYHNSDLEYSSLDWDFDKKLGLTPEQFWEPLDYNFWANLEWTAEGKGILELVEAKFGDKVAILTAPPKTPGAVQGKLDWISRELPRYRRRTMVGTNKQLFAASTKVLVDDRDENIESFEDAGGLGVLVPRPWNRAKGYEGVLLENVRMKLDGL